MGDKDLANGKGNGDAMESGGALDKQANIDLKLGDMTWIKLRGGSWWPAQIVDENAVSDDLKPRKGKSGDFLVRLYGTYEYSYVNPVTSLLEFNDVLQQSKGSQREFFMKMLEQDLSKLQSKKRNARKGKAKGNGSVYVENSTPSKRENKDQDRSKKKCKASFEEAPEKAEASARRLKVMQDLGLKAPSGSPFRKNGQVLSMVL